ncbi:serine/threonine-protein kinase [Streptomyces cinerochromogenes]|uniref:serine/threonine-protein kinase n=1 Tax=Streptomyces cinerochromogenes TaxID=66422 RepID=UPI0036C911A5
MRDQLLAGRYRLVRQLGEGGMGQVWEAQDESLRRPVAVKVISLLAGGGSRGDEARARFLREARITAQLQHANIVTIHDIGESGTAGHRVPFLVMELVRGKGLDAKLRRGAVTLPDAARWGAQICDALAGAHDAGIMHRDVKASNVLVTPSGTVKVLDFGIARAADPYATADRLTQTGFIVGTPAYMAPEQARGFPEPRSDLYAVGCLLFELITGQLPFQSPDTVGYLSAHLTQEPPVPSSLASGVPPAWDDLVLTLLRKDPAQRYADATEVAEALRRLDRAPEQVPERAAPPEGGSAPSPTMRMPATVPRTAPLPPADVPQSSPDAASAPSAAPAHTTRRFLSSWKARVVLSGLIAGAAVVGVVVAVTYDNDRTPPHGSAGASPLVKFKTIPDICGNLSEEPALDDLVDHRRPSDSRTDANERKCGWETERSASVPVDGDLTITARGNPSRTTPSRPDEAPRWPPTSRPRPWSVSTPTPGRS